MNPTGEELDDAGRDTLAYLRAWRRGDDLGVQTILAHADLTVMARILGGMVVGLLTEYGRLAGYPEDVIDGAVDRQLASLLSDQNQR